MKRFLTIVIVYTLVFIAAASAIIIGVGRARYNEERLPVIKKRQVDKAGGPIAIVLGSSHGFYGIKIKDSSRSIYNMASISQGTLEDYMILKTLLRSKKIEMVILPVSYLTNFNELSLNGFDGERVRMFDYEEVYPIHYARNTSYCKTWVLLMAQRAKTITTVSFMDSDELEYDGPEIDKYGNFSETCSVKRYSIADSSQTFVRHNAGARFKTMMPQFDSIVLLCRQNNIKLNLVVMPFTKGYCNAIAAGNHALEFEQYLDRLKRLQSANVKFLDCRRFITENEEINFRDADHLSPCGSALFSAYLSTVILR